MTTKLYETPKNWLSLKSCKIIYEVFREKQDFSEPLSPFNERLPGKLESILGSIAQTYDGKFLYPTVLDAASGYLFKIICEHPFYNGNKRVAILFIDIFLYLNGIDLTLPHQDLYHLATIIARSSEEKVYNEAHLREVCKKLIIDYSQEINH